MIPVGLDEVVLYCAIIYETCSCSLCVAFARVHVRPWQRHIVCGVDASCLKLDQLSKRGMIFVSLDGGCLLGNLSKSGMSAYLRSLPRLLVECTRLSCAGCHIIMCRSSTACIRAYLSSPVTPSTRAHCRMVLGLLTALTAFQHFLGPNLTNQ